MNILYAAKSDEWEAYKTLLTETLDANGFSDFKIFNEDLYKSHDIDFIIYAPRKDIIYDFSEYKNLKAIFSLWAGVETIIENKTIKVPVVKMADEGLIIGMSQWCIAHVLRYHLNLDEYIQIQNGSWNFNKDQLLPHERNIAVLGLGNIGMHVAKSIQNLGFNVKGWATQDKREDKLKCLYGEQGLKDALIDADIVVCLLPETRDTINLFSSDRFKYFKKGAKIINAGRGSLINETELLNSIKSGRISNATLDVFNKEPLPRDHPFWQNEKITVTPHIAAVSRPDTCVNSIVSNIIRYNSGEKLLGTVNLKKGY